MSKSSISKSQHTEILDSDDESAYKRTWRRPRTQFRSTRWDRYYDSWYPEIAAICLSTVCGIAIVAVLHTYNQKPPPSLHYGFTLNAIISIIATTAKVSMIFSISSALGQLKWVWFNGDQNRQLLDAGIFDEASRGPWGSIRLLSTHIAWSLAALGSLLTILALGFDPFVQQVINYPMIQRLEPSNLTLAPVAKALIEMPRASRSDAAIERGFFSTVDFRISPICPSGNCTFQDVPSIGWCSKCVADTTWSLTGNCNITALATEVGKGQGTLSRDCKATSSSQDRQSVDLFLDMKYTDLAEPDDIHGPWEVTLSWLMNRIVTTSSITEYMNSESSKPIPSDQPILEVTSFSAEPNPEDQQLTLDVQRCSFDICLTYSNVSVNSNTVTSNVTRTVPGVKTLQTGMQKGIPYNDFLCWISEDSPTKVFDIEDSLSTEFDWSALNLFSSQNYSFCGARESSNNWFTSWKEELEERVTGNATAKFQRLPRLVSDRASAGAYQMFDGALRPSDADTYTVAIMQAVRTGDIECIFGNISNSLNLLALEQAISWNVTGILETWPTVVNVRPWWLVVPLILYIGTICFLVAVMYLNSKSKAPLWKSSINVLFYHGLDHDMGLHSALATVPEMEARSTQIDARLVPFGRHDRLVLETTMVRRASWSNF